MTKMIQIRNVPDDLHRTLKTRAARLGMSLSDYLLRELEEVAERPTTDELIERISRRRPSRMGARTSVELVRGWRDRK